MGRPGRTDAHIHILREGIRTRASSSDDLRWYDKLRRASGITHALVVGYEGEPRFAGNNAEILAISKQHLWAHPLAFLDVRAEHEFEQLAAIRSRGFDGFALYLPETGPSIDSWSTRNVAELAAGGGIVSVNGTPAAIGRVHRTLAEMTEGSVLISHLGGAGNTAANATNDDSERLLAPVLALSEYPHVFIKISGLYAIDPRFPHYGARSAFEAIHNSFDARRLVWGSDFSPVLDYVTDDEMTAIPEWMASEFSPAELEDVLCHNLIRILSPSRREFDITSGSRLPDAARSNTGERCGTIAKGNPQP